MKTNLFFGLALLSMAPNAVSAQENADSLYIRTQCTCLNSICQPTTRSMPTLTR